MFVYLPECLQNVSYLQDTRYNLSAYSFLVLYSVINYTEKQCNIVLL